MDTFVLCAAADMLRSVCLGRFSAFGQVTDVVVNTKKFGFVTMSTRARCVETPAPSIENGSTAVPASGQCTVG